ncbi:hypothetical protein TCDM_08418 [Trypanosoma cruzi Dm28c]|uniref:Secreted protein n=1 Tax=Trypanosoma cruzi Dm28c TaxID=1416333 RepID=V5ASC4_TRYCR|nr:hypothetical protein TCDM_08418 [Trypanosoma cruzi Dm28c]
MSSTSHRQFAWICVCVGLVCTFHSHRCVSICVSENVTNTQAINTTIWWPKSATNTRRAICIGNTTISNKKSNGAHTAHAYGERDPLEWMFFYWASNAGCGPRRRKRSGLAAQRRPHRNAIECCHGGSKGKQKKQRTGTSSGSVITESRTRVLLAVRLAASIPAVERSFLRSVVASWPDPLLLCRWMLEEQLSRHPSVGAATGLNALRNRDGSPWQSLFSRCRWNRPAPCSLLAVPRNHWKQPDAGGGYRAHLRVVTANNVSPGVGLSGPRNRHSVRA